mmetsp:Transcript_9729/g.41701  ORF Transcript_9729/g.41701 Transcript_9729/m.41701 type:complete len:426 (-) Transcript_9729:479-1756(-)
MMLGFLSGLGSGCVGRSSFLGSRGSICGISATPKVVRRRSCAVKMYLGGGGFLGVGPAEVVVVIVVGWLVLGPKELIRVSKEVGSLLGSLRQSADDARRTLTNALEMEALEEEYNKTLEAFNSGYQQGVSGTAEKKKGEDEKDEKKVEDEKDQKKVEGKEEKSAKDEDTELVEGPAEAEAANLLESLAEEVAETVVDETGEAIAAEVGKTITSELLEKEDGEQDNLAEELGLEEEDEDESGDAETNSEEDAEDEDELDEARAETLEQEEDELAESTAEEREDALEETSAVSEEDQSDEKEKSETRSAAKKSDAADPEDEVRFGSLLSSALKPRPQRPVEAPIDEEAAARFQDQMKRLESPNQVPPMPESITESNGTVEDLTIEKDEIEKIELDYLDERARVELEALDRKYLEMKRKIMDKRSKMS